MPSALSVSNLSVCYQKRGAPSVQAVDGLSFEVAEGEIVGFLGPNGAGKSSTIKAIMGFIEPVSGSCRIFGDEAGSTRAKATTGYLPEVAMYYPFLSPLETLCLYGELQGMRGKALRTHASELLSLVGVDPGVKRHNRSLSKGMLQRVGIAQALLGSPRLLILDEVTSGLDPIGRQELREVLRQRCREGATLFFSSHELSEVELLCDRVLLIQAGKLVEERAMDGLKEGLQRFVVRFQWRSARKISEPAGKRTEMCGSQAWNGAADAPASGDAPFGARQVDADLWELELETKSALMHTLNNLAESGARIVDFTAMEGTLESYFVDTLRRAA